MLYAIKHYELTSYRELLIDVLTGQHDRLSIAIEPNYWSRFDTDYLENLMITLSKVLQSQL